MSHRLAPKGPDPRRAGQERGPGTEMSGGKRAAVLQRKLEGKDRGGGGGTAPAARRKGVKEETALSRRGTECEAEDRP